VTLTPEVYATELEVATWLGPDEVVEVCRTMVTICGNAKYASLALRDAHPDRHKVTRTILENFMQMQCIRAIAKEQA
jgi:hypothetical protein